MQTYISLYQSTTNELRYIFSKSYPVEYETKLLITSP